MIYTASVILLVFILMGLLSENAKLKERETWHIDALAKSAKRLRFLESEVEALAKDTLQVDRAVTVEEKGSIVTVTAKAGNSYRFMDLSKESAKELYYQLSQIDFNKE